MRKRSLLMSILAFGLVLFGVSMVSIAQEKPYAGQEITVFEANDGRPGYKIVTPWLDEFTKETGIKVNFLELGYGPLHTKAATLFATKSSAVDIVWTYAAWTAEFAGAGFLEEISDRLDLATYRDLTPALAAVSYKGGIYGLPKFWSFRLFYWNKKMFKDAGLDPNRPPTTWDEVLEYGKKLTKDTDGDGKIDQWGFLPSGCGQAENAVMDFQILYTACGGGDRFFDDNDLPLFDGPAGVEALSKYVELYKAGIIDPASWSIVSGGDRRARWIKGHTAMVIEWPSLWLQANDPKTSEVAGNVGVSLVPAVKVSGSIDGSEGYAISKFSRHKDAAYAFLKFVASKTVQKDVVLRCGWLPARQSALNDPDVQNSSMAPMIQAGASELQYPIWRFAAPYAEEVMDEALGPAIVSAVKGEKTPEEALKEAADKAKEIVMRYK